MTESAGKRWTFCSCNYSLSKGRGSGGGVVPRSGKVRGLSDDGKRLELSEFALGVVIRRGAKKIFFNRGGVWGGEGNYRAGSEAGG